MSSLVCGAEDQEAINNFVSYLKIQSVHPEPDYDGCISFLKKLGSGVGLKSKVVKINAKNSALILTLEGEEPKLSSILLNSHMDVVPVIKDKWKFDPFGGHIDESGNIYGRGAQDMKSVTIAQLEAIRRMKKKGIKLKRTVHISVLPDEEIGSDNGMAKFVKTDTFKNLNVGFDIDEGAPSFNDEMIILVNEKCHWSIYIHCPGNTGHASLLQPNTAGEKLRIVLDRFMDFRKMEADKFALLEFHQQGQVTSINLTSLEGGVSNNVLPAEIVVGFDLRITPNDDHDEIEKWINETCKAAGDDVYPEIVQKDAKAPVTCENDDQFFMALESCLKKMNLKYSKFISFGATDARFARNVGIPAVGLSLFLNTEWHFHKANEYMNSKEFIRGIAFYEQVIETLGNV